MVSDIQTNRIDSAQSLLVLSICTGKNYEKHASLICLLFNYRQWRSQPDNLVPLCKFHSITIIQFFRN